MSLDYHTLNIQYHLNSNKFEVNGDLNRKGQLELVEIFLRGRIGAEEDKRKPNKQDTYYIGLKWYPEDDIIEVSSDTKNKQLRDGILMCFLENLNK